MLQLQGPTFFLHGGKEAEKCDFLIGCVISCSPIMTTNDQQQLYDNTTLVMEWISSSLPNHVAIRVITGILVSNI
jgi:hypothetical protein